MAGIVAVVAATWVYSRWGGYGLLLAYALTLWYPFTLYFLLDKFGLPTLTVGQLAMLMCGLGILWFRLVGFLKGPGSYVVPGVVVVLLMLAWSLTWTTASAGQTAPEFLKVVSSILIIVVCLTVVRSSLHAKAICWGSTASVALTYGVVAIDAYVVRMPFVIEATGKNPAGAYRLYGILDLPGAPAVEAVGGRATGVIAGAMVIPLVYLLSARSMRSRITAAAALAALAAIETSTIGRAGWLGILAGGLVVVLAGLGGGSWRFGRAMVAIGAAAAGVAAAYAWLLSLGTSQVARVANILHPMQDANFQWRLYYWRRTLEQAKAHPEGIGFYTMLNRYGVYEHNAFLIIATGLGILGVLAMALLWIWVGKRCTRAVVSADREARLVGLCGIGTLVVALVSGMADNTPFRSEMFWLVWGAAAAVSFRYKQRSPRALGNAPQYDH